MLRTLRVAIASVALPAAALGLAAPAAQAAPLVSDGFDGHATSAGGILLAVSIADCIPVFLVDVDSKFSDRATNDYWTDAEYGPILCPKQDERGARTAQQGHRLRQGARALARRPGGAGASATSAPGPSLRGRVAAFRSRS